MKNKRLTVLIGGREALPVRAIPYVTGWKLSPDELAGYLARHIAPPFALLKDTFAYHVQTGSPVQVLPKEWDGVVAELAALEARLRSKFHDAKDGEEDPRGYAAWRNRAISKLPAAVFLWLDEFEREFREHSSDERVTHSIERPSDCFLDESEKKFPEDRSDVVDAPIIERPGERDLVLDAMLPEGVRATVLEGFEGDAEAEHEDGGDEPEPQEATSLRDNPNAGKRRPVTRNVIMGAFPVRSNPEENKKYWDRKLGDPPKWLIGARLSSGGKRVSARWDPVLVAHALLGHNEMNIRALDKAIQSGFPDDYKRWCDETDDVER